MTDRELLELAAKAAGIKPAGFFGRDVGWYQPDTGEIGRWDPLEDDGDALRLAVALDLHVQCDFAEDDTVIIYGGWIGQCVDEQSDEHGRLAATRRAIVRAAAEIGRAMP